MKKILCISLGSSSRDYHFETAFLGHHVEITKKGTDGSYQKALALVRESDGNVDAISLGSMQLHLECGGRRYVHQLTQHLVRTAHKTIIVDGSGIRNTLERWAVRLIAHEKPDIFNKKNVLVLCGLHNYALADVLSEFTNSLSFADPMLHFRLPLVLHSFRALALYGHLTLPYFAKHSYGHFYPTGRRQDTIKPALRKKIFEQADIIAGDFHYIRHYSPEKLRNKTILTNYVTEQDTADLKERGVTTLITVAPRIADYAVDVDVLEALFLVTAKKDWSTMTRDDYLNTIIEAKIQPGLVFPQGNEVITEKFAFVIHPLHVHYLSKHRLLHWLKNMPHWIQRVVEWLMATIPPIYYSHITGIQSLTGKEAEGWLIGLGGTPRELLRRRPESTYRKLVKASKMAERRGARIMGLGAFTKIVGDAGMTVAKYADIPITSGNSYSVSATLEAAKVACIKMGMTLDDQGKRVKGKAMIVGATGAIGSVSSRLLSLVFPEIILVAPRGDKLLELQSIIEKESLHTEIKVATDPTPFLPIVDLILTTTSARGRKVIDIMKVKPGAVICDVARPLDISEEDAGRRPDVLVIESGELEVPGNVDFGSDIGLPDKIAYACLAETMVLALEGRYECFTLGREIEMTKVKEIYKLGLKHGFKLAGIRGYQGVYSDQHIQKVRELALQRLTNWTPS